jgi:flavin reductase (DIM6/NTAB) family NADH-FMN oxidoreductase RutF
MTPGSANGRGETPSPVTPAACRNTLGLFTTGVTVVTVADPDTGEPRGMTANAFMSVSLEPPLIVVSVRREARLHALVERAGVYGVSLLSESLEREARRFAGMPVAQHEPGPEFDERAGVPILRHALAWVVARVVDAHRAGDHTLFLGELQALAPQRPDQPPLAFFRSQFARVTTIAGTGPIPLEPWDHARDMWG